LKAGKEVTEMGAINIKRFNTPDERRSFADKGFVEILTSGEATVGRAIFEPGWKWSEHVKPIAGTSSCQTTHCGYVVSGGMHLVSDEGDEFDIGPGDVFFIEPGHDAWVIGDEACICLDFVGMGEYAKARGEVRATPEVQPAL
jgi:quercetin dioxygenase-like cupin family protein